MPLDSFKRRIDYLRVSVTDRCNLRCRYCLPEEYSQFSPREEALSDDELVRLLTCFAQLGFTKIRLTGGEPLVRPGLCGLISRISKIAGISDIALSTNGMLLAPMAEDLAKAGLKRINISLDTMNPEKFREVTRFGDLATVMGGIEKSLAVGINPVKLNVVVIRGTNEMEIADFARLTETRPIHVRFIELMPMGETGFFSKERLVPMAEILERAGPLEVLAGEEWPAGHGPAKYYKRPGAQGTVGVISAMSCNFCAECNRVRLSSKGVLVPCLDGADGTDFGPLLRAGAEDSELEARILDVIERKPEKHFMLEKAETHSENPRFMCQIGG